jgi:hypothetical protein
LRVLSDFGLRVKAVDTLQSFFMLIMKSVAPAAPLNRHNLQRRTRRLLERDSPRVPDRIADEIMNLGLRAIDGEAFATALVFVEERKTTSLIVSGVDGVALGVVHFHDLWNLELI